MMPEVKHNEFSCMFKKVSNWGAGVVKHLTLNFSSGHDLTVHEIKPQEGIHTNSAKSAWDSLSLSLSPSLSASPPLLCIHSLSLKINKLLKKESK